MSVLERRALVPGGAQHGLQQAGNYHEVGASFECAGQAMFGVLSLPDQPARRAVLIVVGGPQYRAGSHRQFTLLARRLAEQGIAALRFDYRGMGDSEGEARSFDDVGDDLRSAVDHLAAVPGIEDIVIWGLCDAASAALFYAGRDKRVSGLVLLNPWARTTGGVAKATLKHYYRQRLMDPALWKKIASGRFDYRAAAASFVRLVGAAFGKGKGVHVAADAPAPAGAGANAVANAAGNAAASAPASAADCDDLPGRMLAGLNEFKGKVLLIMSGADLTAQEFSEVVKASRPWQRQLALPRVSQRAIGPADHTFSRRVWRDQVADWTAQWVKSW